MATIGRLVLRNFKRFKTLELEFEPDLSPESIDNTKKFGNRP